MSNFVPTLRYSSYESIAPSRPELSVRGKSVLITGGSYGIGAAIARSFCAAGASRVAITGRTESKLQSMTAALTEEFPSTNVSYFPGDVADEATVTSVFESFGAPDILVNNAAVLSDLIPLAAIDDEGLRQWWKGLEINVFGTALFINRFLRLRDKKKEAVIIIVNSNGAHWGKGLIGFTQYAASKAALARMAEMIHGETPEVRIINVHPGYLDTPMGKKAAGAGVDTALVDAAARAGVTFDLTEPALTGDFVVWLTSPEADFLSGKFVWANWDVDELKVRKAEIVKDELLEYTMKGF